MDYYRVRDKEKCYGFFLVFGLKSWRVEVSVFVGLV